MLRERERGETPTPGRGARRKGSPADGEQQFVRAASEPIFAVISDVHANLEALRASLEFLDRHGVSAIVCLGDIVGYGPQPCECIDLLRTRDIPCLRGNHDTYAFAAEVPDTISTSATVGIRFARTVLRDDDLGYLRALPLSCLTPTMAFVHASFPRPEAWVYVGDVDDAVDHLGAQPRPVSFLGHTHVPEGFFGSAETARHIAPSESMPFPAGDAACFNPGAIGQPRDGDPRASLLICDQVAGVVRYHRVPYDFERTAAEIRRVGLPEHLAIRLRRGM